MADLQAVIRAVTDTPTEVPGLIFTGARDRAFSAGMDLGTFRDLDPDRARAVIGTVRDALTAVRTSPRTSMRCRGWTGPA